MSRPCKKWKDALEIFRLHEKTNYHKTSVLSAENVIAIVENKQKNIILQVDQHKREEAEKIGENSFQLFKQSGFVEDNNYL